MSVIRGDDQSAVIDFLQDPSSYPHRPKSVERIDTHGAILFLAGDKVYKLKRAVKLAYLDFSTLEKRRAVCEREWALNSVTAPELYLGVLAIRRSAGGLRFGGEGDVADWVIEMRRFDEEALFDRLAGTGRLDMALIEALGRVIERFHAGAPKRIDAAWPQSLGRVMATVIETLRHPEFRDLGVEDAPEALTFAFETREALMAERRRRGWVRRCHGDLHLKNIVLLDGAPRLFDALEFDEDLASIDVLYDLAFLLMDLWHRDLQAEANAVLNHYISNDGSDESLEGLGLLPLFLSLRAGVRAMVGLDGLAVAGRAERERLRQETHGYALLARALIAGPPPRLVAIGGLSGTGKTTLARALAPKLGAPPGAIHLRSDLERKRMFGVALNERLGPEGYAAEANAAVYARLMTRSSAILQAGHSVIIDATFLDPAAREALQTVAGKHDVPLQAVWLEAGAEEVIRRVAERLNDASDADARVVEAQLDKARRPPEGWLTLDAGGDPEATLERAAALLCV